MVLSVCQDLRIKKSLNFCSYSRSNRFEPVISGQIPDNYPVKPYTGPVNVSGLPCTWTGRRRRGNEISVLNIRSTRSNFNKLVKIHSIQNWWVELARRDISQVIPQNPKILDEINNIHDYSWIMNHLNVFWTFLSVFEMNRWQLTPPYGLNYR